jgi:hypothetical protein
VTRNQVDTALFAFVLCCVPTLGLARVQTVVPQDYRGEWTNQQHYCGQEGDNLDSVLTVTATSVGYYDNNWRVRRVRVSPNGLFLTYWPRTDFTIYAPNRMRLSRDKQRIYTSDDSADHGTQRCPRSKG